MNPRYLVIANPEGKRWQAYQRELTDYWGERGIVPEVVVLPWRTLIPQGGCLDGFANWDRPGLVRIESPGRDAEVTRMLLEVGGSNSFADRPYRKGELLAPRLQYLGFRHVLEQLKRSFDSRPFLRLTACPLAIAELFDKRATARRLEHAGIPCPPSIPAPASGKQAIHDIRAAGIPYAYVKLNTGSSAVGIAVVHPDDTPWAITSLIQRKGAFFCTRELQRIEGDALLATLDFLLQEDAVIQRGIPMAQIDGQNFDVRVIMQHGQPRFSIFRLSSQPMTNLHLGGRRGKPDESRAAIPTRAWLDALDHCVEAARLYPCDSVGIDVVFQRGYFGHYLLEINAFGDFFPGLVDERGRSVYRVEIENTARAQGWIN